MKRILLILLYAANVQGYGGSKLTGPNLEKSRRNTPKKHTPTKVFNAKKHAHNKLLQKIKLANPGQNARLLLRSPMHLRTFFPGTQIYMVR